MATDPTTDPVEAALVGAYTNGRYNADREAFLDGVHRWLMFAVIFLGASALLDQLSTTAKEVAAILTAAAGAIDLVFDLTTRARKHGQLRRLYFDQAAALQGGSATPKQAGAAMLAAAGDEEPPYYALHALAENWATEAVFGPSAPRPCVVGWWGRRLRHLKRYDGASFSATDPSRPAATMPG